MKIIKSVLSYLIIILSLSLLTGCWNYREVDKLAIIAGVAIDKGTSEKYRLTVEIVEMAGHKDTKYKSKIISVEGNTIFDSIRNVSSLYNKILYWSHIKALIIHQDVASSGLQSMMDWFIRDSETRADAVMLISRDLTAADTLKVHENEEYITSYQLSQMLVNEKNLSKAPHIEVWDFYNNLLAEGIVAISPSVSLMKSDDIQSPQISETAIFRRDKLVGFIDAEETKCMLFIQDKIKRGIFVVYGNTEKARVSLEILKNKTKVKPKFNDKNIEMDIYINMTAGIEEIIDNTDYIDGDMKSKLEKMAENDLKVSIENTIKKVQKNFGVDIFGFGAKLREDNPKLWNEISKNWESIFRNLKVNVITKVHTKNSGLTSDPLKIGD